MHKLVSISKRLLPFADQAVVSGGNFATGILLARALGLADYGSFALCWMAVLFWSSIHQAWLVQPMFTLFPKLEQHEQKPYLNDLWIHHLAFAGLAIAVTSILLLVAGPHYFEATASTLLPALPAAIFAHLTYDLARKCCYALNERNKALVLDLLIYGTQLTALFLLNWNSSLELHSSLLVIAASYSPAILLGAKHLMGAPIRAKRLITFAQKHWTFSRWLLGTALLQWLSGNFFIAAAASILSPVAVGAIRVLQNTMGLLNAVFLAYENAVPLKAAKLLHEQGVQALFEYLRKHTLQGLLLTATLAGTLAAFGPVLLELIYGPAYAEYAHLLYSFGLLYLLIFLGTSFRFALRTLEQTRILFVAYVLSALFSILFANPILQATGIAGVVVGLILTQLIMQACFVYALRNQKTTLWKSFT